MTPRIDVGLAVETSPPMGLLRGTARLGRVLGFDSLWLADQLTGDIPTEIWDTDFTWLAKRNPPPNRFYDWTTVAGSLARSAGRLHVGVGVADTLRRHPAVLAQSALTLSHLTKATPVLGLGAGEADNLVPYGIPFDRPVARFEEALTIIRHMLDSPEPFTFEGRFHSVDGGAMALQPGKGGKPRLWVAAHGPRMLRLAGRFGDGWYPTFPHSPDRYRDSLETVRRAASDAGRDPARIVPSMLSFFVGARTEAAAAKALRHPAVRFMALLGPHDMWDRHGLSHPLGEEFRGVIDFLPERHRRAEIWKAIEQVPPEILERELIWGTPDRIVEQVRALGEAGLRHIVFVPMAAVVSPKALVANLTMLPGLVRKLRSGA